MAYGEYYVERQGWAHWPKTLIMCRKTGHGIERRRYVEERKCHVEEDEDTGFLCCSECGAIQSDDYTVYYCWSCGRKVVDE